MKQKRDRGKQRNGSKDAGREKKRKGDLKGEEEKGERGGESICFLSGVQLEEEQTTKEEEEEEEEEVPADRKSVV